VHDAASGLQNASGWPKNAIMKPLENVRVVELARVLAGPWCGQLLADLGATVIKVERPGSGDDTRHWGPPFVFDEAGQPRDAAYYHSANRGKTSVFIDIATPEGQDEVHRLLADADVLIENYKVGGLIKYGLGPEQLRERYPQLVICSITGFGQTGPYSHRAGYDFIIQAMGGFMSLTGEPDGPPQKAGLAYVDILTGLYSSTAILAALRKRDAGGGGAHIDMALLDTQVAVLANQALNWMTSGEVPHRMGNGHVNLVPYQSFSTRDGELVIAVGNDRQFRSLCTVLNLDIGVLPEFATNAGRIARREELIALLEAATRQWATADLAAGLEQCGVPAGPINTIDQVFEDPQVIARGLQIAPEGLPGLASPIVIDGKRMVSDRASPQRRSRRSPG